MQRIVYPSYAGSIPVHGAKSIPRNPSMVQGPDC